MQGSVRPGQPPKHRKQQHTAVNLGKELCSCPRRDLPSFTKQCKGTDSRLQKQLWKTPANPLPVQAQPLSGGSAAHLLSQQRQSPSSNQLLYVNHVSSLRTNAWRTLPCPRALYLLLDWGCVQERQPFSRCVSCLTLERLEQMVMCSASSLRTKTFLLSGTECLEAQYLQLFPRGC